MNLELLPLTLSELDGVVLPDTLPRLLAARRLSESVVAGIGAREHARRQRLIAQYEIQGGLPGACFIRDSRLRTQKIIDQLETVLDRDLRQIHETTLPLPEILRFTRELALHDGSPIRHEGLRRATGITPPTQKKLLFALEAAFVLRHVPIEGDFSGSALFFEDHAEVAVLARTPLEDSQRWNGLVYRNLREQVFYRLGENLDFFQYRTRAGVLVPFAVRGPGSTLGFIPVRGAPTGSDLGAARSFLRRYVDSRVVLVTDGPTAEAIDDRTLILPATSLLL